MPFRLSLSLPPAARAAGGISLRANRAWLAVIVLAAATASGADAIPPALVQDTEPTRPKATGGWADLIDDDLLRLEIERAVNRLDAKSKTVEAYDASLPHLSSDVHTLAILAEVAAEHPNVQWKDRARHIRDLAGAMASEKLQRGAKSHQRFQQLLGRIALLLKERDSAIHPKSPDKRGFSEIAQLRYLMQRMHIAYDWLKLNVKTAEAVAASKEEVLREAGVLTVLGKVVASDGFGYQEFESFAAHANALSQAGRLMTVATQADDFAEYDKQLARVARTCTECHGDYR